LDAICILARGQFHQSTDPKQSIDMFHQIDIGKKDME
jgi:hypothetical protein